MNKSKMTSQLLCINLLICIVAMGMFAISEHLSVDDYYAYFYQRESLIINVGQNLRPISSGVYYLLDLCGINTVGCQGLFGVLITVIFAWLITRISYELIDIMRIKDDVSKVAMVNGGTLIMFLNASLSEYLYYSSMYLGWIMAVVGLVYAAICIGKEEKVLNNWLIGTIMLTVTAGSYQTFISQYAYVVMAIIFIRNEGKITRKSIFAIFRAVIAALVAMGINLFLAKAIIYIGRIEINSRMDMVTSSIPELIDGIIQAQKSIWTEGMGMYPRYTLSISLLLLLGLLVIVKYKNKKMCGGGVFIFLVLISGQCVMYMAQIMQGYIRVTNRGMLPIFGVYTIGIWLLCYYADDIEWKKIKSAGIFIIGIFLLFSSVKINEVAMDTIKTNTVSRCYIEEIFKRICNYEKQNGIEVTKIGFCSDEYISYRYYRFIETSAYGDMCANPFLAQWSDLNSIYYYTGRNFDRAEVPDCVIEYYKKNNWDDAEWDEQLVFDEDSVYICVF